MGEWAFNSPFADHLNALTGEVGVGTSLGTVTSAVVLFSGGLDSTTVAWDLVSQPFRYGVNYEEDLRVCLLTGAFSEEDAEKKAKNLSSLVMDLQSLNEDVEVDHEIVVFPAQFESYLPSVAANLGSVPFHGPLSRVGGSAASRRGLVAPFTPQLHTFLVAVAANLLSVPRIPYHSRPPILCGFQYEPPTWDLHDANTLSSTDTSPEWVESVNRVLELSSPDRAPQVVAPFLERRMSKFDILEMATVLGLPIEDTSSCEVGWKAECGQCPPCVLRGRTVAVHALYTRRKVDKAREEASSDE